MWPTVTETDERGVERSYDPVSRLLKDRIILLDYKTDRVKTADELVMRYRTQLDLYADALTRVFSNEKRTLKAEEKLIYSFRLKEVVTL